MASKTTCRNNQVLKQFLRGLLFRGLAVACSALVFGILLEIAVRLFVPSSLHGFRDRSTDWQPHPRLGWVQKPNLDVATQEDGGMVVRYQTNSDGLTPATAQRTKQAEIVRVMIFGDSGVVGRAVPQDKTIHAYLQKQLQQKGLNAEVINAGVEGYSTDQELIRMEELVPLYRPDIVLLEVCNNDFAGNEARTAHRLNKPRFNLAEDGSLEEIVPEMNDRVPTFRPWRSRWLYYSAAYRLLSPRLQVLRARFGDSRARNLVGLPLDLYYQPAADQIDWKLFRALLLRMKEYCQHGRSSFILYAHPHVEEVWDPFVNDMIQTLRIEPESYNRYALEERLQAITSQIGLDFCPLVNYFVKRQDRGPFHLLPRDPHCNPAGYELTAEALAEYMANKGILMRATRDRGHERRLKTS